MVSPPYDTVQSKYPDDSVLSWFYSEILSKRVYCHRLSQTPMAV